MPLSGNREKSVGASRLPFTSLRESSPARPFGITTVTRPTFLHMLSVISPSWSTSSVSTIKFDIAPKQALGASDAVKKKPLL